MNATKPEIVEVEVCDRQWVFCQWELKDKDNNQYYAQFKWGNLCVHRYINGKMSDDCFYYLKLGNNYDMTVNDLQAHLGKIFRFSPNLKTHTWGFQVNGIV
jgi:hypothetical protein